MWDAHKELKKLDEVVESYTKEGESPVVKNRNKTECIPSSTELVEFRVNQPGPPGKAKY